MGKTKTAFVSDTPTSEKSGKEAYLEKMKKKAEKEGVKENIKGLGLKGGERIKVVAPAPSEPAGEVIQDSQDTEEKKEKKLRPKARGKKYAKAQSMFDKSKLYPLTEAIGWVKKTSYSKFDGSVELHIIAKSSLNKTLELPFPTGKTKRVEVASEKTIEKLQAGTVDFDILLSTPEMMPKLVPFAKTLGPKSLMPNPKNGTLIKAVKDAEKFSASSTTLKTQKDFNVIHLVVGKVSQKESELLKNISAVFETVDPKKIERAFLSATMGPSVKVKP